ncbi:PREDICTED: uncharacterized protein LOC109479730 [Branchiostoma belcheri]|uniref:Uncharacterized protein LOC109479730 n=1 Tax=Branchiostoma belcheri TaxID=7741 RepID=A0A6P4ZKF0_BRABE|nr:PREDICTED: uncharacterized protein LOC109479730 [Branchiostoma belcheri]
MSGRKKGDYRAVFSELIDALPGVINLQECVLDFESALWQVLPQLFPHVRLRGCSFHWAQAVWRHAQQLGLQVPYKEDERVHRWLRRLLALPYLPVAAIPQALTELQSKVRESRVLTELAGYVERTWLHSSAWPPRCWSVYGRSIRTNNDVEGWHNRLNQKARKPSLPLYLLIDLLHRESCLVKIHVRLVTEGKLRRHQRAKYRSLQGRLFDEWDNFSGGRKTAKELLEACAKVFGPPV